MDGTSPSRERKRGAMADYQEFLDGLDRAAYHEGELTWEEDGFTVTRTYQYSPPGCHDSCGVLFYAKDGKLDHVEGDPLSPFTNGKLCMRCLDLPEIVNHPDRVLHPMKRARERPRRRVEVRAHHVGRGVRPHRRKGQGHPRGIRLRVHRVRAWHGPQRQLAGAPVRARPPCRRRTSPRCSSPGSPATCRASAVPWRPWATSP